MIKSILEINKLSLPIRIGVEEQERSQAQIIEFNLVIEFNQLPQACHSDRIEDAICYANIVDKIKKFCQDKEFKLIEHLGFLLHKYLENLLPNNKLKLQICKTPPIAEIKDNCCFTITS